MSSHRFKPLPLLWYLIILALLILSGFFWLNYQLRAVSGQTVEPSLFIVAKGMATDDIATNLKDAGLIRSPLAFKYIVARLGISRSLQAGSFRLSPSMNTQEIALALTQGTLDVWVTLKEGWRREEIAEAITQAFKQEDADFNQQTFLTLTKGKEGYLYPDTYLIPLSSSEEDVAKILTTTFDQKVIQGLSDQISHSSLSLNQLITLASLIEREARTDGSRQMISGILHNRLNIGMALQVDATLQYVLGLDHQTGKWWSPPLSVHKQLESPYNTYKYPGLPPAPICSPSLSSIQAALNPTSNDYLYYLTGNDGQMYYATTLDQHNQNIRLHLQ